MDRLDTLAEHQAKKQQLHRLIELARRWEKPIRAGLTELARTIWPDGYIFGLIPAHRFRLRRRFFPGSYVWWIEHDIPPYDRYWCAAYQVTLYLDEAGTPTLNVQSGTAIRLVRPLTQENLTTALAQVSDDLLLLIPRHMGRADDP